MAEGFTSSPSRSPGTAEDSTTFVNLEGGVNFNEKLVTAVIQFLIMDNGKKF